MEIYQFIIIISVIGGGFATMIGFITKRVPKGECKIRHDALNGTLVDLKAAVKDLTVVTDDIKIHLARMNGKSDG